MYEYICMYTHINKMHVCICIHIICHSSSTLRGLAVRQCPYGYECMYIYVSICVSVYNMYVYICMYTNSNEMNLSIYIYVTCHGSMGWHWLVGSIKL